MDSVFALAIHLYIRRQFVLHFHQVYSITIGLFHC